MICVFMFVLPFNIPSHPIWSHHITFDNIYREIHVQKLLNEPSKSTDTSKITNDLFSYSSISLVLLIILSKAFRILSHSFRVDIDRRRIISPRSPHHHHRHDDRRSTISAKYFSPLFASSRCRTVLRTARTLVVDTLVQFPSALAQRRIRIACCDS